jgi:hypothetical protein
MIRSKVCLKKEGCFVFGLGFPFRGWKGLAVEPLDKEIILN